MWWETAVEILLAAAAVDIILAVIVGAILYFSGTFEEDEGDERYIVLEAPDDAIQDVYNLRLRLIKINNSDEGGRLLQGDIDVIIHLLGVLTADYTNRLEGSDAH